MKKSDANVLHKAVGVVHVKGKGGYQSVLSDHPRTDFLPTPSPRYLGLSIVDSSLSLPPCE